MVNELPALLNGVMTFGCLNNFSKVNGTVVALWKQVLRAVPDSRLLVLAPPGGHRSQLVAGLGIGADRVEFVDLLPPREYLKQYHRIDICLDTFPYNGHTTSLGALWMGVPVVTLCGEPAVSRAGFSQLSNLGMTELVAYSAGEFAEIASRLADDLPRLAGIRRSLRERMRASPLMDAKACAQGLEQGFRIAWTEWCHRASE